MALPAPPSRVSGLTNPTEERHYQRKVLAAKSADRDAGAVWPRERPQSRLCTFDIYRKPAEFRHFPGAKDWTRRIRRVGGGPSRTQTHDNSRNYPFEFINEFGAKIEMRQTETQWLEKRRKLTRRPGPNCYPLMLVRIELSASRLRITWKNKDLVVGPAGLEPATTPL